MTVTPEKAWRQTVIDAARLLGWSVYFTWNSIHSPAGFPDLVLCRGERLIFAELKNERGKLTPAQRDWLDVLGGVPGVEVTVWRPQDWDAVDAALRWEEGT